MTFREQYAYNKGKYEEAPEGAGEGILRKLRGEAEVEETGDSIERHETNETLPYAAWVEKAYAHLPEQAREVMVAKSEFDLALQVESCWLSGGEANEGEAALLSRMGENSEKLITSECYVTDIAAPSAFKTEKATPELLDGRELQEGKDIVGYGRCVEGMIAQFAPAELVGDVQGLLGDYLAFVADKKVFTRPGIDSSYDLTHDYFLNIHIAEERAARTTLNALVTDARYAGVIGEVGGTAASEQLSTFLNTLSPEERATIEEQYAETQIKIEYQTEVLAKTCERIATSYNFESLGKKSADRLPGELQLLLAERPEAAVAITDLQKSGAEVVFADQLFTDPNTLEAMQEIGVKANANYQTTWLHNLVVEGKIPPLTRGANIEKDIIRKEDELKLLEVAYATRTQEAIAHRGVRKWFSDRGLARKREKLDECKGELENLRDGDLTHHVERISNAVGRFKTLVALRPDKLTEEQCALIETCNADYLRGINVEYADKKLQFDISSEQTAEAQELLRKLALIGPVAQQLEMMGMGGVAKFFAGTADDVLNEVAEIQALKGQGFTMKQIVYDRWKMLTAGLVGGAGLAIAAEHLYASGDRKLGGAAFGLGAVTLSLISCGQSIKMFHKSFEQLLKEGKVDVVTYLRSSDEFKEEWKKRYGTVENMTQEAIVGAMQATFDTLEAKDTEEPRRDVPFDEEGEAALIHELEGMSAEDIRELVRTQTSDKEFEELNARGEVKGIEFIKKSPAFKKAWVDLFKGSKGIDAAHLIDRVRETLVSMRLDDKLNRHMPVPKEVRDAMLEEAGKLDPDLIQKEVAKNSSYQAWKQAIIQDFNHPARLGIFLGALSAPVLGATVGAAGLLTNGFMNTAVGGAETYGAFAAITTARWRFNSRWKKQIEERVHRANSSDAELDEEMKVKLATPLYGPV